jgi:hypothetical protein
LNGSQALFPIDAHVNSPLSILYESYVNSEVSDDYDGNKKRKQTKYDGWDEAVVNERVDELYLLVFIPYDVYWALVKGKARDKDWQTSLIFRVEIDTFGVNHFCEQSEKTKRQKKENKVRRKESVENIAVRGILRRGLIISAFLIFEVEATVAGLVLARGSGGVGMS